MFGSREVVGRICRLVNRSVGAVAFGPLSQGNVQVARASWCSCGHKELLPVLVWLSVTATFESDIPASTWGTSAVRLITSNNTIVTIHLGPRLLVRLSDLRVEQAPNKHQPPGLFADIRRPKQRGNDIPRSRIEPMKPFSFTSNRYARVGNKVKMLPSGAKRKLLYSGLRSRASSVASASSAASEISQ